MSTSVSQSTPTTYDTQTSVQGGSGASPTVVAGGAVDYNDPTVSLASLQDMTAVIQAALAQNQSILAGVGQLASSQLSSTTSQSESDANLLASILANNQQLAQNSQTGGATAAISQSNYLIWGLIGLAGLAILAVGYWFIRKK